MPGVELERQAKGDLPKRKSLEEEEDLDETLTEMAEAKSNKEADKDETEPRKTPAASRP